MEFSGALLLRQLWNHGATGHDPRVPTEASHIQDESSKTTSNSIEIRPLACSVIHATDPKYWERCQSFTSNRVSRHETRKMKLSAETQNDKHRGTSAAQADG